MADSGTYTPETIQRRLKIAEQLLGPRQKPITHWAEGLDEVAKGLVGGLQMRRAEDMDASARKAAIAQALQAFGGSDAQPQQPMPAQAPAPPVNNQVPIGSSRIDEGMDANAKAIAGIESGGKYDALGPMTKGDRAYGKYQVMGANIPTWTKEVLGREMTPDEFLRTPEAQEAVFKSKFGALADKHGPEGAARAWFAGEGGMNDPNRRDILGTSVADYGRKFAGATGAPQASPQAPPQNSRAAALSALMNPWTPPALQGALVSQLNPTYGFQPLPDGTVLRTNPRNGQVEPVYQGAGKETDDIKEFEYARKQGFTGTLEQWMQRKRGGAGEYGLQPIWGVGPDGKPAVMQLGKSGEAIKSKIPADFQIAKDPIKVEGPTGTVLLDPQTRQQIGFVPKDVAGAAQAKEEGEAKGQAIVNLPTVIATAENTLKTIDQLEKHPGKKNWGAFGIGGALPDIPGTATRGFGALVDQVKGQNFMTAFQALKGAGAITEQEGAKAEKAQARLDRAQSEADFDTALNDLKDVVRAGMERARQKAGGVKAPEAPARETGGFKILKVE